MTFQPPSKSLTPRDYQFISLVLVAFIAISFGLVRFNLKFQGRGGDFFVEWAGLHSFVVDKVEPYSWDVASRVQSLVYGRPALLGDQPYILTTPFHLLLLYFPFAIISDPGLARAMFVYALELALAAFLILGMRLSGWNPSALQIIMFLMVGLFNFYSAEAVLDASPVLLLGLVYLGIVVSLEKGLDELAGALIAVSLYYWEVGAPFLLLIILRVVNQRRIRVFAGIGMVTVILLTISFLLYPGWVIPYLRAGMNNFRFLFGYDTFYVFSRLWPAYGRYFSRIFVAFLLVMVVYEWSLAAYADERRYHWAISLALSVTPLLGLRTNLQNLAILLFSLAYIFGIIQDRWKRKGDWLVVIIMLAVLGIPWALTWLSVKGYVFLAREILFLFLPLTCIIGLYWIRWWVHRPPRLWAELVRENKPDLHNE